VTQLEIIGGIAVACVVVAYLVGKVMRPPRA
jgi:hypothetical protein